VPSIYEILQDSVNYPDGVEFTAPDGNKVSLGMFRAHFAARERELDDAAAAIAAGRTEVTNAFSTLMGERDKVAVERATVEADRRNIAATRQPPAPGDDRVARVEASLAAIGKRLDELKQTQFESVLQYTDDKWRHDLEGVELPKGMKAEDVLKYAMENRILDGKIPNLRRAVEKIREPETWEKKIEEAREDGLRRGRAEAALAATKQNSRVIPPSSGGEVISADMRKIGTLDNPAWEDIVAKDPEIMEMAAGIRPAPPVVGL